jgi:type I site-specific restriction endonuclease
MANGHDTWFWEVGLANPRLVASFFTPADLERLKFLRQNRRPLEATSINSTIVDRPYQHEAIRRLTEAFAANTRRALLVMATGTGKTRVAMALIDVFLRARQAQNVLFLADRDALSLFNTRLKIIERHLPDHSPEAFRQAVTDIRAMMARVPQDSFPVKKVWLQVSPAWENDFWTRLTPEPYRGRRLFEKWHMKYGRW